jgi:hypothetical protein
MAAAALAVSAGLVVSGTAGAGGSATTKVTIRAPGGEIFGKVKSPDPETCAADRKVKVFREKGGEQGGGDDEKIGTDNAELIEGTEKARWSIGNPGIPGGKKVYAKAGRKEGCKKDSSPTIRVEVTD